jgi:type VI secretion system protein ImpF
MPIGPSKTRFRASLLDRLLDAAPRQRREVHPLRTQDSKTLRAAVARDLGWLLNTRTPLDGAEFDRRELTVIDFGIPDFGGLSPENPADRRSMARRIARALAAFEPRLASVRVTVAPRMSGERGLEAFIEAELAVETLREPVAFRTVFQQKNGMVEIHDDLDG